MFSDDRTGGVATAETVLVVEDDVLVRLVIASYLRDCGYRVLEAASADEALRLLQRDEAGIDIVLTDVQMPGELDGFALAQWVRRERPQVEVVMAGTPARAADAAGDLCEQGPTPRQTLEPSAVLSRIRRLLAMRRRP
ncbi:MAG TPA: response regulator [Caulobacteraceae bacterium]|jgi:CheY-like chemotaxis protein|nr:response regulator [Caulobacteraceae bacterium]